MEQHTITTIKPITEAPTGSEGKIHERSVMMQLMPMEKGRDCRQMGSRDKSVAGAIQVFGQ
ncbi:hypothetical protein RvY_05758 [Ramazzottius varieornatus]|uniref:Uncharacterized protein n=1 Tax=Ramazzottius varieornatus TaxID=947166 RepID=A0A1D1UZS6_RAMVA|nr:hypothetical protein RvY_05758 [Ramazzottius varieornatus]